MGRNFILKKTGEPRERKKKRGNGNEARAGVKRALHSDAGTLKKSVSASHFFPQR